MFKNKRLSLSYESLEELYEYFGIYRIQMQYLLLNQKIHLLGSMAAVNPTAAQLLKKEVGYQEWVLQESQLRACLEICLGMQNVIYDLSEANINSWQNLLSVQNLLVGSFSKYKLSLQKCLSNVQNLKTGIWKARAPNICSDLEQIMEQIITDNDPHIRCYYIISIGHHIKPIGITTSIHLPFSHEISLRTKNINIDDVILNTMTLGSFTNYFLMVEPQTKYEIQMEKMHIKFDLDPDLSRALPWRRTLVDIQGMPPGQTFTSCVLRNYDLDPVLVHVVDTLGPWMDTKEKNECYVLDQAQYKLLDDTWKKIYSFEDCAKNSFVVEYLFQRLGEMDRDHDLIRPSMFKGFCQMAMETSIP